jgi:hypothetical protein
MVVGNKVQMRCDGVYKLRYLTGGNCPERAENDMSALAGWENFYEIVGSSAGALIGLQFVVMALIANMPRKPGQALAGAAFATPTIVHFGTVLLLSAALSAPWQRTGSAAFVAGLIGFGGVIYAVIVTRRMRMQTAYKPEFEDWLFHCVLPFTAYVALSVSGLAAFARANEAMFGVAAALLMLLFIGIHNAWDGAAYHVFVQRKKLNEDEHSGGSVQADAEERREAESG